MKKPTPFGDTAAEVADLAKGSAAPLVVAVRGRAEPWRTHAVPHTSQDARFEIGSVSKILTGSLLGILVHAGEIDPDQPVDSAAQTLLPWKEKVPTLAELSTHRSGLPNTPGALRWREAATALGWSARDPWSGVDALRYRDYLRKAASRAVPSERFRYSSMGIGLLADAMATVMGRPFEQLLQERLLMPLGMTATSVRKSASGADAVVVPVSRKGKPLPFLQDQMPAAGAYASTAADLRALLDAIRGGTSVSAGLALAVEPKHRVRDDLSVGYCWLIDHSEPDTTVLHNGGTWGSQAHVSLKLDSGRGVVALSGTYRPLDPFAFRYYGA